MRDKEKKLLQRILKASLSRYWRITVMMLVLSPVMSLASLLVGVILDEWHRYLLVASLGLIALLGVCATRIRFGQLLSIIQELSQHSGDEHSGDGYEWRSD